jgi:hypothetical protein
VPSLFDVNVFVLVEQVRERRQRLFSRTEPSSGPRNRHPVAVDEPRRQPDHRELVRDWIFVECVLHQVAKVMSRNERLALVRAGSDRLACDQEQTGLRKVAYSILWIGAPDVRILQGASGALNGIEWCAPSLIPRPAVLE